MRQICIIAIGVGLVFAGVTNAQPQPGGLSSPEGTAWLGAMENGSFGWYQRVTVGSGISYTLEGDWRGDLGGWGWAEVLILDATSSMSDAAVVNRINVGSLDSIVAKHDSYPNDTPPHDLDYGPVWGWESFDASPNHNPNPLTMTPAGSEVVIALKMGTGNGPAWASWDNMSFSYDYMGESMDIMANGDWSNGEAGWMRYNSGWGAANWAVTPEPSALALIVFSGLGLLPRRRRA